MLAWATASFGEPVVVDGLGLLAERARATGFRRGGSRSVGGVSRLLPCADGWIAVSLARPDDIESLPAWLGIEPPPSGERRWIAVAAAVRSRPAAEVVGQARLLALPVAAVAEMAGTAPAVRLSPLERPRPPERSLARRSPAVGGRPQLAVGGTLVWPAVALGGRPSREGRRREPAGRRPVRTTVVLRADERWQGAGCRGSAHDRRHRRTARTAVRRRRRDRGVAARALEQLGLDARSLAGESSARAWVAITGYGQNPPEREWVAFGDDAAAAGGLVVWDDEGPCFCADAVADPLTGLLAATAASIVLATGGRRLIDVALARRRRPPPSCSSRSVPGRRRSGSVTTGRWSCRSGPGTPSRRRTARSRRRSGVREAR